MINKNAILFVVVTILACACQADKNEKIHGLIMNEALKAGNPGAVLVKSMIDASGGLDAYHSLKNVEYTYIYRDAEGLQDVSLERYIYKGEKSWARYLEHNKSVMPNDPGEVIQVYDGSTTWTSKDGVRLMDEQAIATADFLRKTNFYWFNMMYKLLDPGVRFEQKPDRTVDGDPYHIVEVTFGEKVGDAQDIYVLYLNPQTGLVDRFLFTVMDFERKDPLMMEVTYENINGLSWPAYRRYTASNWDGEVTDSALWVEEISRDIRFNIELPEDLFTQLPE